MIQHRPEIDGLRAFAIIPVIFFHAGFSSFDGGFIGVDIFFVISGFLITSIIISDIEKDKFTIASFYERRVRRILPALFLVVLLCIPPAWTLLPPSQLQDFGESVVAVVFFISNVLFLTETGYFQNAAEVKPLLHTWSLAIEEQYYLLFPLFMTFVWKRHQKIVIISLVLIIFSSFILAQLATHIYPSAGFFLLPTRAWELLIGSLSAIYVQHYRINSNDFLAFIGFTLIITSIHLLEKTTPFPGIYAIPPVAGTALLLVYSDRNTIIGKFLGNKVLVGVGLISYSAYLLHQPLFVFLRILRPDSDNKYYYYLLIFLTFFLAYFSWKYVENPFRKMQINQRRLFRTTAFVALLIASTGFAHYFIYPFPSNYDGEKIFRNQVPAICDFYAVDELDDSCLYFGKSKSNLLIWGDSHAWALSAGLRNALSDEFHISQVTTSACRPSESNLRPNEIERYATKSGNHTFGPACKKSNAFVSQLLRTKRFDAVIIAMAEEHIKTLSPQFIHFLEQNINGRIIVIGPAPQWHDKLPRIASARNNTNFTTRLIKSELFEVDSALKERFFQAKRVSFYSLLDLLCSNNKNCIVEVPAAPHKDRYISWDYGHLSLSASNYVATHIRHFIHATTLY